MNNQNSKCCGSSVTAISSDEGTSYYQCNRCLQPTDVISKCCEKCHAYIKAFPSSPNCDNPNCHCHTPSKCCEKCVDVYFEKDYPAHTAHEACINPICECHTTSKGEEITFMCPSCDMRYVYKNGSTECPNCEPTSSTRLEKWTEEFDELIKAFSKTEFNAMRAQRTNDTLSGEIKSFISTLLQEERNKTEHLSKQIDRLANWIMENMPDYIKAEGAVDTAIEIMYRYKDLLK